MRNIGKLFKIGAKLACFIAAIWGCISLEENATSNLVAKKIAKLNNEHTINRAIQSGYHPIYKNLADLQEDYPAFKPETAHWSKYGSALLYLTQTGWGLGNFSVRLPDMLVVIDQNGTPVATRRCGSVEGNCEIIPPRRPELGVTGVLHYTEKAEPKRHRPITAFIAQWTGAIEGEIIVKGNCFWAHTTDATRARQGRPALTIMPSSHNTVQSEYKNVYGYYKVAIGFQLDSNSMGYNTMKTERITKDDFMQEAGCNRKDLLQDRFDL